MQDPPEKAHRTHNAQCSQARFTNEQAHNMNNVCVPSAHTNVASVSHARWLSAAYTEPFACCDQISDIHQVIK